MVYINKLGYVYILTNLDNSVLYTGVTSNIFLRTAQHKEGTGSSFTTKYKTYKLVFYQSFDSIQEAISFEKVVKNRGKSWKIKLIEKLNPDWKDLGVNWDSDDWLPENLIN